MSDPLQIAAAGRHLLAAQAQLTTALTQLGLNQWSELVDGSELQEAIAAGQDALMCLERAVGLVSRAQGEIDRALEMRPEPVGVYGMILEAAE